MTLISNLRGMQKGTSGWRSSAASRRSARSRSRPSYGEPLANSSARVDPRLTSFLPPLRPPRSSLHLHTITPTRSDVPSRPLRLTPGAPLTLRCSLHVRLAYAPNAHDIPSHPSSTYCYHLRCSLGLALNVTFCRRRTPIDLPSYGPGVAPRRVPRRQPSRSRPENLF